MRELDASKLSSFQPKGATKPQTARQQEAPEQEPWPSREPTADGQFTIRAPLATINRFKKLCKDDRRTYADMLGILMDSFEQ